MFNTIKINDGPDTIENTVEVGKISYDGYDDFDKFKVHDIDNYLYIVICDSGDIVLDKIYFQLFTSLDIENGKYLQYETFQCSNLYILRFENTKTFEYIITKTIDYIKFSIKSICINLLEEILNNREEEFKCLWSNIYYSNIEDEDEEDEYIKEQKTDINDRIDNKIEELQDHILDCAKQFVLDDVIISKFEVIKLYNTNTSGVLFIRNIDLEQLEKDNKLIDIKEYLYKFTIPEINEDERYKTNNNIFQSLIEECDDKIEFVKSYITKKLDENDMEFSTLLVLLKSNKVLLEDKLLELDKVSSVLLEKEKRNARIICLSDKIEKLLKQVHDNSEFKQFDFQFISKYYLGYKNMIKTIMEEEIVELQDKIPLLQAKQKSEEENESVFKFLDKS